MKRVEAGGNWSLFCPNEAPGMVDSWGEEFETLYEKYEAEGRARRTVKAQDLWFAVLDAQIETGAPRCPPRALAAAVRACGCPQRLACGGADRSAA